jgi:hypothetical protein
MVVEDLLGDLIASAIFLVIGFAFLFDPGILTKHHIPKHGIKFLSAFIPNRRLMLIFRVLGIVCLSIGIIILIISYIIYRMK